MDVYLEATPENYTSPKISITIHYKPSARYAALELKNRLSEIKTTMQSNKPIHADREQRDG